MHKGTLRYIKKLFVRKEVDIFPLYSFPKIWEDFPVESIKILRKKIEFDNKLKEYFLDDLAAVPSCNRVLCPACLAGRN